MNFKSVIRRKMSFSGEELVIETGFFAQNSTESITIEMGGTKILISLVLSKLITFSTFTPLRVDYQERAYSYGKIPGGFLKREGRQTEREVLISRLIDRSIRPLVPTRLNYDIQINIITLSIGSVDTDFLSIIGTSLVLSKSIIPLKKQPLVAVKVGFLNGVYFLNKGSHNLNNKEMSLLVSGTKDSILMVDIVSSEVSIDIIANGLTYGLNFFKELLFFINNFLCVFTIQKELIFLPENCDQIFSNLCLFFEKNIDKIYKQKDKKKKKEIITEFDKYIVDVFLIYCGNDSALLMYLKDKALKKVFKEAIIKANKRFDNRLFEDIRPISIILDYLESSTGSVVFTRGNTQVLTVVTLGSSSDRQITDDPFNDERNSFLLHYNFPSFCVGELGNATVAPKRREIGHGNVAKRSLISVFPSFDFYPRTVRVVSDVIMSDGSSSMASVCGASLALMCSGVPIKDSVAGIAMGFVSNETVDIILYDINSDEDCFSDFDFKISGTRCGVTSIQLDITTTGITPILFNKILYRGRQGYLKILDVMDTHINKPRILLKEDTYVNIFKIDISKIKNVIGKGGSVIKSLISDKKTNIDIQKDGSIVLTTKDENTYLEIKNKIEDIVRGPVVGNIYIGKITKIVDFGLFVMILPGIDGLLHISLLRNCVPEGINIFSVFHVEQIIQVSVVDLNKNKIKLNLISL